MTAIKFCRRAVIFNADAHWITTQGKCSKKTAAEVVANYCGVSATVARSLIEKRLEAIGTGTAAFSGVGQYGGFSWQTKVGVSFEYVATIDVIALISELHSQHSLPPVKWELRYAK